MYYGTQQSVDASLAVARSAFGTFFGLSWFLQGAKTRAKPKNVVYAFH
jgi:hypothetical protein